MRIPTNSNFTKEMSKRLQRIINPQTTLEELQNLQEEVNMINPVDTYLQKQVSHLEKANATTKAVVQDARTVRSTEPKRKGFVEKTIQDQTTQKRIIFLFTEKARKRQQLANWFRFIMLRPFHGAYIYVVRCTVVHT